MATRQAETTPEAAAGTGFAENISGSDMPRAQLFHDNMSSAGSPAERATLAWVAHAGGEEGVVTLWTQEQELQVQLRDGRSFVRGQLVCLEEQAEGGAALVFGNADDVPLEEVQRFLGCIALRESSGEEGAARAAEKRETSTQTPHHERAPTKKQSDAATQTPHDGPSALFTEELLRCAAEPARCTSTAHIMQTVRQLGLLHERRLELQGRKAPADGACRPHDHEAWASCVQAAVSAGAPSVVKRARAA